MNKRQLNGEDEGVVHHPGLAVTDTQTLCGHSWATVGGFHSDFVEYEDTKAKVTCKACLWAEEEIREMFGFPKRKKR